MGIISKEIVKEFGHPPVQVIKKLDISIEDGEFVSISGRSGSGKTTLLYLLSSLDNPTSGQIWIDGQDVQKMKKKDLHLFRNDNIGFIFQFHYLLPEISALENVLLPARLQSVTEDKKEKAKELLNRFDVYEHKDKLPGQLSGGQQQRISIARALLMEPRYIFADEPTGNLDLSNGLRVMEILKEANEERGTTLILVTHDPDFADMAKREIYLIDGRIGDRSEASEIIHSEVPTKGQDKS